MLEVTLRTRGWKGPCWILHNFLHLPLVIQRTLARAPFLGCVLCVGGLKVLKRECLSERYNPIIVQGNSEQTFQLYHLCLLTTELKMQQNPNLFPRCTWLGIWPKYNFKKWTNAVVPLKDGHCRECHSLSWRGISWGMAGLTNVLWQCLSYKVICYGVNWLQY